MTGEEANDDLLIIEQLLEGHTGLFPILVRRYQQPVFNMGMGFFHNRDDAADFSQDVFLKVFRSLSQFEGKSRFSTWLYKIAYNTGLNSISRRQDYRSLAEEDDIPDFDSPERQAMAESARGAVKEAVSDLPERFRICVDLFFFYDRTYQEIEAITGYPVNTIKSHVFRAKKMLKKRLEEYK